MYYILETNYQYPLGINHLVYEHENGWGSDFLEGNSILKTNGLNKVYVTIEHKIKSNSLPDYLESNGTPVVNQNFLDLLLQKNLNNLEYFKTELRFEDKLVEGYYALNFTGLCRCIDEEKSESTKLLNKIFRLRKLTLKNSFQNGLKIFRDSTYNQILFINSEIKECLEKSCLNGFNIMPAEGWNDAHRF